MTHECVVWDLSCSPQRRVAVDGEMLSQGMGGMAFTQSSQGIARAGLFVDVSSTMLSALSRFTHARPFFSVAIPTLTIHAQEGASSQYTQESFSQFGGR